MVKLSKYQQPLIQAEVAQLSNDEGGLNLNQTLAALRRRATLIAGVTAVVATAAVLHAETAPPIYQGSFEILTKPLTGEGQVVANVPQTIGPQNKQVGTTIEVLVSPRVVSPVIKKLKVKYENKYPEIDFSYDGMIGGLAIVPKQEDIIRIEYQSEEEEIVRIFLNALADAYLEYSLAERQEEINQAISFVNQEIKPLRQRVENWQERLQTLRQTFSLVDPSQKAGEISGQIASMTSDQLGTRVQLTQMRARYQDLQREFAQQPGASASNSLLSDNARYQQLLNEIVGVNVQIAARSSVYTDEDESMQRLYEQKASLTSLLAEERARVNRDFQSRILELEVRDKALTQRIEELKKSLKALTINIRDHDNIQRELGIATDALVQFTAKQQALQIEKSQKQQPWKVLDPEYRRVQEPFPIEKKTTRNLVLGSVLGLLLGAGAALVMDKLSNIIYTSDELKEFTGLPMLGVVPLRKEIGVLAWQEVPGGAQQAARASFFEIFRSLYTNILLLGSDTPIRSIVISSAAQEEGKSTVAIHLALAAAAMGQKVLLVDSNLRSPSLHNRVGLMNIQGLTDIISSDLDWKNVIEQSPIEENMFVLTAGPVPPDSVRLLASQKMQNLMSELQANFDLVIYDTPPLVGFADANLLAANTNGLIVVAGLGQLKRSVFKQALEELQISGTPTLGVIGNKSRDAVHNASYTCYQHYYKQRANTQPVDGDEIASSIASSRRRL
jgi:succinoglycan biosynthesis transport protein ExoP